MTATLKDASKLLREGTIALSAIESNGLKIDVPYLDSAIEKTGQKIKDLEKELTSDKFYRKWRRRFGDRTNLGARQQLATLLFDDMGYKSHAETETGKKKADKGALDQIDIPFVKTYLEVEKLKKVRTTYLIGIKREVDPYGFLHPVCNLGAARTYRSGYSDPNFQNIPVRDPEMGKIIRRAFIPRSSKHCLVDLDYSQIEVRVAACYNKDPVLIRYIKDKTKDMHRDMAAQIYRCPPDKVSKMTRYCAKNQFVFPEFYGSYWEQCAPILYRSIDLHKLDVDGIPMHKWLRRKGIDEFSAFEQNVKEAENDFWKKRFRVYAQWKRDWVARYNERGWCRMLTGFIIRGHLGWKEIINYPIQGAAFHCLLQSLVWVQNRLQKTGWGVLCGQIHDALIGDILQTRVKDYIDMAQEIMVEKLKRMWKWIIVPLEIEAEVTEPGENWHTKKGYVI